MEEMQHKIGNGLSLKDTVAPQQKTTCLPPYRIALL
jgi:hypothetical protein